MAKRATTTLMVKGQARIFTRDDLRALRDALAAYLAAHPPETRSELPSNWRDSMPPMAGEPVIDEDGARLPPWVLGTSSVSGEPVLAIRWLVPHGGGYIIEARLQQIEGRWSVEGLSWIVVRPLRR